MLAADSGKPNGFMAIRKMTEMKEKDNVVAFIGPDHSCVSEALVASAWNLPMITYVCICNFLVFLWILLTFL